MLQCVLIVYVHMEIMIPYYSFILFDNKKRNNLRQDFVQQRVNNNCKKALSIIFILMRGNPFGRVASLDC